MTAMHVWVCEIKIWEHLTQLEKITSLLNHLDLVDVRTTGNLFERCISKLYDGIIF